MNNTDIQVGQMTGVPASGDPHENAAAGASNSALLRAMAALRRHWMWVVPLAMILAIGGAVAGYNLVPVQYRSTGSILVKPVLPRVLYQTEDSGVMPMFSAFLQSQIAVIQSQRVIDLAMQMPPWKDLGLGGGPEQAQAFAESLEVTTPKGSGIILVSALGKDPQSAAVGARSIIQAYEKVYAEMENTQSAQTMRLLETRSSTLGAELRSLNERVLEIANEFGSAALDKLYDFKLTELSKLESEVQQVQVAIALAGGKATEQVPTVAEEGPVLDAETIAHLDPQMARLLSQRNEAARRLRLLQIRLLPAHHEVVTAQRELELLDEEVTLYAIEYRAMAASPMSRVASDTTAAGTIAGATIEQLRERERNLALLTERARSHTLELGRKRLQIETLQLEIRETENRLHQTRTRIEQLSVESGIGGRIDVMTYGELPNTPYRDKRKQAAAGGGLVGMAIGLSFAVLLGLTDRRCRSISDARYTTRRVEKLLGVLPNLPSDLSDPDQAATAAHYVHHIRALLQIGTGAQPKAVAITSSAAGSGKTSLALALGLSFAASGERTLLVDCDIVGGGLTRRLQSIVHRKLGQILLRSGVLTSEQLDHALLTAEIEGTRLGEACVKLGCASREQIDHALSVQKGATLGLMDVLAGETLADCLSDSDIPNLHVLPLGSATARHISQLSPAALRRFLDVARAEYDVVLVDTGPVPGSIEASMVTAQADQVVMVIARGEERHVAERALDYLLSLGANVAGIVFNRADASDIVSSGHSQASIRGDELAVTRDARSARLGPVAQAVSALAVDDKRDGGEYA